MYDYTPERFLSKHYIDYEYRQVDSDLPYVMVQRKRFIGTKFIIFPDYEYTHVRINFTQSIETTSFGLFYCESQIAIDREDKVIYWKRMF